MCETGVVGQVRCKKDFTFMESTRSYGQVNSLEGLELHLAILSPKEQLRMEERITRWVAMGTQVLAKPKKQCISDSISQWLLLLLGSDLHRKNVFHWTWTWEEGDFSAFAHSCQFLLAYLLAMIQSRLYSFRSPRWPV